ncbi:MAG: DNA alkylation repair protein [Candidatus Moranbacteria bacterium]|nr:DNA alkylation repair protein [Candidatus Moranbacteria bacterium]
MKTNKIIEAIRQEIKTSAEKNFRKNSQKFHQEKIVCYEVRTPIVRKIAAKYFKQIKTLSKEENFNLSEKLLKSNFNEEATIAIQWVGKLSKHFEKKDFEIFEEWLGKYMDNWAKVDDFCLHVIQPMIEKYPELIDKVKSWSRSGNMWLRRASAVSFIATIDGFYATKQNLADIFEVAENLLQDKEDLVQKGCGWMLKAASVHHQKQVFDFVMKHKQQMPRTALRYAIEKMPDESRKQAMEK